VAGVNYLHISVGMEARLTKELSRMEPRNLLMTELFLKREKAEKGTGTRGARFLRSLNIVKQARGELGQAGDVFFLSFSKLRQNSGFVVFDLL